MTLPGRTIRSHAIASFAGVVEEDGGGWCVGVWVCLVSGGCVCGWVCGCVGVWVCECAFVFG